MNHTVFLGAQAGRGEVPPVPRVPTVDRRRESVPVGPGLAMPCSRVKIVPSLTMPSTISGSVWSVALAAVLFGPGPALAAGERTVSFNRDIRPILADHCYRCHGPDPSSRKADLRLDTREGATEVRDGSAAIVPGDPGASSLVERIRTHDLDDLMPPPEIKKPLSPDQVGLLQDWIRQGAAYEGHWAFEPISRPPEPAALSVRGQPWARNAIDRFILARLEAQGVEPAPEADRRTLYRRLSLDLTGLPPRPEDVEAFVVDPDPRSYDRVVETLLASEAYGERMAVSWLDWVRYGDTVGYHGDQPYPVSAYRDYVIRAFNENLPFDQFTVENLAGDLLATPTRDQRIASGYNRLLMITAEGGAQDREYRAKYAADRVRNASAVWLGVTLGCAECHDHKYDPLSTRDFYRFSAFFADLNEKGFYDRGYPAGDWGPALTLPTEAQSAELSRLRARIEELEGVLRLSTPELVAAQEAWEEGIRQASPPQWGQWHSLGPFAAESLEAAFDREFGPERNLDFRGARKGGGPRWVSRPEWVDGTPQPLSGENSATYLWRSVWAEAPREVRLSLGSDDAILLWLNGEKLLSRKVQRGVAPDQERVVLKLRRGANDLLLKIANGGGGYAFYFRDAGAAPPEIEAIVRTAAGERSPADSERLAAYFRGVTPRLEVTRTELAARRKALEALEASLSRTLVSEALAEPRMTRVLRRGNWLDHGGEMVEPGVPEFLPQPGVSGRRLTRRDLAEWMVAPGNPLTARVFVNRLWKQFFGVGLSKKLDDLGAQGEWPSHPELLDWLASEFRDSGWNVKHIVRRLVGSSAYRQASRSSEDARDRDPENRWVARQASFRLDAEFVRDSALAVSGLLVRRVGGESVKPYQPEGYYAQLNFPRREYQADGGENQYRRGLYTHWQRTFLHPSLAAFDAPTREECTAERVRSNTPQQALTLLNDPTYVEAARALAERILREARGSTADRVRFAVRAALTREPRPAELSLLEGLQEAHAREYATDPEAATRLVGVGDRRVPEDLAPADLAAWTSVARVILNLHEMVTRY